MTKFNHIEARTVRQPDGWRVLLTYSHSDHDETRNELSTAVFASEGDAEEAAQYIVAGLADGLSGRQPNRAERRAKHR